MLRGQLTIAHRRTEDYAQRTVKYRVHRRTEDYAQGTVK